MFLCMACGCIFNKGERKLWYNLTEAVLDPQPNDGWDGAAGVELRDAHYEAYPHAWDYDARWCQVRFAIDSKLYAEITTAGTPEGRSLDDIPSWIIRAALVALPPQYRQRDIW